MPCCFRVCFGVALVWLAACSEPPTQVLVRFDLDEPLLVDPAGSMRVRVSDVGTTIYLESRAVDAFAFPTTLPIVRSDESTTEEFRLDAELLNGDGTVLSAIHARARFVKGKTRSLWLRFYALCDPACTGDETCFRDACTDGCFLPVSGGSAAESEPTECWETSPMDGGPDGDSGRTDGGIDAASQPDADTCSCPCDTDLCISGACQPPADEGVVHVNAGSLHACAIRGDGSVWCWGLNDLGQLGDTTFDNRNVPTAVVPYTAMGPAADVVASQSRYTCAAARTGSLWCWGESVPAAGGAHLHYPPIGSGRFGDPVPQPVDVEEPNTVLTLFAGREHTCARELSGAEVTTECMGRNDYQQLAREAEVMSYGSLQHVNNVGSGVTRASAGLDHNCVIHRGLVKCWGRNSSGQAGIGTMDSIAYPPSAARDVGVTSWIEVGLGWNHSCAIGDTGALYCWGAGGQGRLGTNSTGNLSAPAEVDPGPGWTMVDGGNAHTCGIRGGALLCWGSNGAGELGDGSRVESHVPVLIGAESDWHLISTGNEFTCGIRGAGQLYCWGNNEFGRLGIGSETAMLTPTRVCFP